MIRAFLVSYRINNDSFCVSRPITVHDNVPFLQFFRTTLRKPLRSSSKPILLPSNDATWIIIPIARYLKIFQNRSTIPSISNKFKYRSFLVRFSSISLSPISFIISSKYVSFFSLFLSKSSFGRGEGEQPSLDRAVITKLLPALYIPDIFEPRDRSLESNHVNNHPFQKLATKKKTNSHLATSTPFPPRRYARGMMPTSRFQSLSFSRCRLPHARRMQSYIDASNRSVTRNNLCGEAHASVSIINGTHR